MHNELLKKAFEKAEKETETNRVSPRAKLLSDFIFEDSREQYGEKSLRDKYAVATNNPESKIRLKKHAKEALSHYLGYEDYKDFLNANSEREIVSGSQVKLFVSKNKITIMISLVIITGLLIYNSVTRQRWMVWQKDHYIEVKFDLENYDIIQLKLYKEERIKNFKKIKPNCDYEFFNADGSVRVWYGKNIKRELEFFTDHGLHPETGKTLKPITQYMINKYICNNEYN
ncbi:hypothetical protein [Winogradskyella luteola]|uniref:Uncharacterized protein n=1 Tax=Winogradskyella luteola TaxID=2828330 RepID=A0A9X1F7T2_9FLAO|nr:hypothetical protein [Winogradskyella luteola]MBV7268038.1 hypothetical protein [Winogradskyella luteola]